MSKRHHHRLFYRFFVLSTNKNTMTPELQAALQDVATKFGVEISGTVTPVTPTGESFDFKPAV